MLPSTTYTIEDFIKSGRNSLVGYEQLSFLNKLSNGTLISIKNVIGDYIEELKNISSWVVLDDNQYRRYKYRPKLLCQDIYKNTEVYYVILLLNNIADIKEFDLKRLRMLERTDMNILLSAIYSSDYQAIGSYNDRNT